MGDGFTILGEIGSVRLLFGGSLVPFMISPLLAGSDRGFPKHLPIFCDSVRRSTHSRLSIKRAHRFLLQRFSDFFTIGFFLWARKLSL